MRATNPARSFHHRRCDDPWFAKHLQRDATAHNIHDGIHRADFVEMNFARELAVNLSLGIGDALEDGDGFLLHPRRELALGDELLDRGKIPTVIMRMIVFAVMFVTMIAAFMVLVRMFFVVMISVSVIVRMLMAMLIMVVVAIFSVFVAMIVIVRQVNVELDTRDALSLILSDVQMEAVEF